jgi:hypothetical protein
MVAGQMRWMIALAVGMTVRRCLRDSPLDGGIPLVVQVRFRRQMQRKEVHPHQEVQRHQKMQPPSR